MAFDGGFTCNIARELKLTENCHIDKLYQPSADELVFLLRKKGFTKRLLISARPGASRVHFTEYSTENPASPPMFCMLARKYFSCAKIISAVQKGFERLIEFTFETTDELGDIVHPKIICELIGNQSNIVLVNGGGRIIDAVRRSSIEQEKRMIQPGAVYEYPEPQDKLDLLNADDDIIIKKLKLNGEMPLAKALISSIGGLSPLICREIAYKLTGDIDAKSQSAKDSALKEQISILRDAFVGGKAFMLIGNDKLPFDYSFMPVSQYGSLYSVKEFPSFSELLDAFYHEKEEAFRIKRLSCDIAKLVNNLYLRAVKRMSGRMQELEKCGDREVLRKYGELIKSNIYLISAGDKSVTVADFYDENMAEITIPLDPALNAAGNAVKYFKEYKKSCTAVSTLTSLIEKDRIEVKYLESVLDNLSRCESSADIAEIREEIRVAGYIRSKNIAKQKRPAVTFKEYTSTEGYRIAVGKNNIQNDMLTLKTAAKNDLWFHTKDIHGSHVIVFCGGRPVSDETLLFAARLAAKNSKARDSSKVPVDYTYIKYVKKPSGAKPGMVIYTDNKTLYVNPTEDF